MYNLFHDSSIIICTFTSHFLKAAGNINMCIYKQYTMLWNHQCWRADIMAGCRVMKCVQCVWQRNYGGAVWMLCCKNAVECSVVFAMCLVQTLDRWLQYIIVKIILYHEDQITHTCKYTSLLHNIKLGNEQTESLTSIQYEITPHTPQEMRQPPSLSGSFLDAATRRERAWTEGAGSVLARSRCWVEGGRGVMVLGEIGG